MKTVALALGIVLAAVSAFALELSSTAFKQGDMLPPAFTCDGPGPNPPLAFGAVPAGTRQLVLTMTDPDVRWYYFWTTTFDHWVVWDIVPSSAGIAEGAGLQIGMNGLGQKGYAGPCPPDGVHRYVFRLYAVDIPLGGRTFRTSEEVEAAINGHVLAQAELTGRYERIKK